VRNTAFRQFWDVRGCVPRGQEGTDAHKDITPLAQWPAESTLGSHNPRALGPNQEPLVLLVRGELLKKHPNTRVYAIEGRSVGGKRYPALAEYMPKDDQGALVGRDGANEQPAPQILPLFTGTLRPDLTFFGFPFTVDDARGVTLDHPDGVYLVIEELLSEARFGLDLPQSESAASPALDPIWENFDWNHLQPPGAAAFTPFAENAYIDDRVPGDGAAAPKWNTSSATIAWITLQRPLRIVMHASQMLAEIP
jgi:hypothetical protein